MPRFQKGPTIHSSAWVVPGATVLGDVILKEESSVWYGAVLRGDINRITIGPRSNVQDNAVVHVDTNYPTTVGELVTIGHTAVVHACTIDNEVLVGMGAIILDDVEVGARSIIGANAILLAPPLLAVRIFSSVAVNSFAVSLVFAACFFVLLLVTGAFCQIVFQLMRPVFGGISEI
jgi:carbonic anhydrase/acetyltransferase-like protein (isoleucine patch superfamily)